MQERLARLVSLTVSPIVPVSAVSAALKGKVVSRIGRSSTGAAASRHAIRARHVLAVGLALLCCVACATGVAAPAITRGATTGALYSQVERLLARLTIQQKIGQMVMAPADSVAATGRIGGVLLFGPDVTSPGQGRAFIGSLQRLETVPLFVAVDQEGGSVSAMSAGGGVPAMLAPARYGAFGSADRVYGAALLTGRALRSLGVNMDLAPVLDVLVDPYSPIGDRSFGRDPALVARLGIAAIRGYQDGGVAATAKHFLGLGSSSIESHHNLPVVRRTARQLEQDELTPMRAAIAAGVDALMVTHAAIPALDPSGTPASLSRPIVTGVVRRALGYQGLIMTDSLAMGGLSAHIRSIPTAAVQAIEAGNDMVLIAADAPTIRATLTALDHAVFTGRIPVAAVDAAARHILTLKARLGLLRPSG